MTSFTSIDRLRTKDAIIRTKNKQAFEGDARVLERMRVQYPEMFWDVVRQVYNRRRSAV